MKTSYRIITLLLWPGIGEYPVMLWCYGPTMTGEVSSKCNALGHLVILSRGIRVCIFLLV